MPPLIRNIIALVKPAYSSLEVQVGRLPIGQASKVPRAARAFSSSTQSFEQHNAAGVRRSKATTPDGIRLRRSGVIRRFQSTWEHWREGSPGAQPKRSNVGPLLGAVAGASVLAYWGSAVSSHLGIDDEQIESSDGVNITDAEGKASSFHNVGPKILTGLQTVGRYD